MLQRTASPPLSLFREMRWWSSWSGSATKLASLGFAAEGFSEWLRLRRRWLDSDVVSPNWLDVSRRARVEPITSRDSHRTPDDVHPAGNGPMKLTNQHSCMTRNRILGMTIVTGSISCEIQDVTSFTATSWNNRSHAVTGAEGSSQDTPI